MPEKQKEFKKKIEDQVITRPHEIDMDDKKKKLQIQASSFGVGCIVFVFFLLYFFLDRNLTQIEAIQAFSAGFICLAALYGLMMRKLRKKQQEII